MLEILIVFGSAISAFGLGYMITQFDVIIPILFGRQWRADDMWWRQIIGATIVVSSIVGFLFIASKIEVSAQFLPQGLEWIWVSSLTTASCFAGLFYADIKLRNASRVVTMIINAMFPSSNVIPLGAKEVNASEKILSFLDNVGGPYKNIVFFLANAIDSPFASWYFLSTFTRFSNLSEKNQQLFVRKWMNDDILIVRSLSQAFKAMGSLGYYTDPRIAKEIGFPGPFVPRFPSAEAHQHDNIPHHKTEKLQDNPNNHSSQPSSNSKPHQIYGITKLANRRFSYGIVDSDMDLEVDVCIVGSGASGPILARELSLHKEINKVILLERGSYYEGEDFNQRELDMISNLWKGGALTFTQNFSVFVGQAETLGGGTVINHAICIDTPQVVLDEWKKLGVSSWITDTTEFQKVLDEVKKEINVHHVATSEINRNNQILKEGAELLQIPPSGHGPNPRNCVDCRECGFSHLGCHYDAKQSTLVTYIPWALQTGKCQVYCDCYVDEIIVQNKVVKGIKAYFQTKDGKTNYKLTVKAKIVIISAGAINSSALLLRSKLPDPNKVVGKGLSIHPSPLVLGDFSEKIQAYKGIPMSYNISEYSVLNGIPGVSLQENSEQKDGKQIAGGFMLESVFPNPGQLGAFLPYIGEKHQNLMKRIDNYAAAGILIRDTPKGTITLNMSKEPVIQYELDEYDKKNLSAGIQKLSEIYLKKGAQRIIMTRRTDPIITKEEYEKDPKVLEIMISPENLGAEQLIVGAVHPQGGNRMGEDPKNSVVNSKCHHHHVKNLFVCDASVFPTATGVNPMLTIMGIAKRTAQFIKENWSELKK
jgi:choline dehydrogenase-like flavoprotein